MQKRLLVVALDDRPDAAVDAWKEIRPRLVLDELERGSFELMPLIYRNLRRAGHHEPELPRLKGIYRRAWVKNNLLTERTKEINQILLEAGIPALFVEGVVLAARFYPELGLRPTSFIDVLVQEEETNVAIAQLARTGWAADPTAGPVSRGAARYLYDRDRNVCGLRSRLSIDCFARGSAERHGAFAWAKKYTAGGVELGVLPPTETLFAVCVSHARAEALRNVQWIADAKMVLEEEIDWRRLLALAQENAQVSRLGDALGYLGALPGPKPPMEIHDQLASTKVEKRESLTYLCTTGSIRGLGPLPRVVAEHLAATPDESLSATIASFPRFLRSRWDLAHTWQVPLAAGRRAVQLLGRRQRVA